ncbi:MAG: alpha/beta hydrolase [Nitratireductor sp.]|nr:alpha/beta hydrolase [Nitratireductor sp.]
MISLPEGVPALHTNTRSSNVWFALEQSRALFELWQFTLARPMLRLAPKGVGRPVLVLPGFLTDDDATAVLRHYLSEQRHIAYPWTLGVNLGPTEAILDGLEQRLDEILLAHGEPVSLVGVSLGGLYARDLARRRPDSVRQVITLASPFRIERSSQSSLGAVFDSLSSLHVHPSRFSVWTLPREPLPVPATAIYTRSDGIVAWETCLDEDSRDAENIEVIGSHSGLVHLPTALYAVADRLAQQGDTWNEFAAPAAMCGLYPQAGHSVP